MSVGVGVGLVFLAREGISFASLRRMSEEDEAEAEAGEVPPRVKGRARARARVARLASKASWPRPPPRALARGVRRGGVGGDTLPVADGGEGTLDALAAARGGAWHGRGSTTRSAGPVSARWLLLADGTAVVEAAEAIPLDPGAARRRCDASSRGLGECSCGASGGRGGSSSRLGGTATMDGGAGLLDVLAAAAAPTVVACDVDATLVEAAPAVRPAEGRDRRGRRRRWRSGSPRRGAALPDVPGAGAAGGLGAALASLGAELLPGAPLVLDELGFDPRPYDLVVTGEGTVDRTTAAREGAVGGRAPLRGRGRPCVVFGGRVDGAAAGRRDRRAVGRPRPRRGRPRRARPASWERPRSRVAASPATGGASTRAGRSTRRSAGTPRTSCRGSGAPVRAVTVAVRSEPAISAISPK